MAMHDKANTMVSYVHVFTPKNFISGEPKRDMYIIENENGTSCSLLVQSPRNKSSILIIQIRILIPDAPHTAARNDPSHTSSKFAVYPEDELPVGSVAQLLVVVSIISQSKDLSSVLVC